MQNLVVLCTITAIHKIYGYGGEVWNATFHTLLGHDLTQVSVRFGTATLFFNNLFQSPLLRRNSNCRLQLYLARQVLRAHPLPRCSVGYKYEFYLACRPGAVM